jgi:hypothetical protein
MIKNKRLFMKGIGGLDREDFKEAVLTDRLMDTIDRESELETAQIVSSKSNSDALTLKFQERSSQSSAALIRQRSSFDRVNFKTEEPRFWERRDAHLKDNSFRFRELNGSFTLGNSQMDTIKDSVNKDR